MSEPSACIFCRIRDGEIPGELLFEDDRVFVIRDINPQAPVHLLVIPKEHIRSVGAMDEGALPLISHITGVANRAARDAGIADSGYRLALNEGPDSRSEVPHLHMHVLGGALLGRLA